MDVNLIMWARVASRNQEFKKHVRRKTKEMKEGLFVLDMA
jgi:hypothetical protein